MYLMTKSSFYERANASLNSVQDREFLPAEGLVDCQEVFYCG